MHIYMSTYMSRDCLAEGSLHPEHLPRLRHHELEEELPVALSSAKLLWGPVAGLQWTGTLPSNSLGLPGSC